MIRRATLGLALAAAGLVPGAALADHCDDAMVIFSGVNHGVAGAPKPKVNVNAACTVLGEDAGDTRIINAGSNEISVRFTPDFGAAVPQIQAVIDGLGFDNKIVTLTRGPGPAGQGIVYDSPAQALNPAEVGCITAVLTDDFGGANNGETAFHTVGSSC
jgi:hypothetical protein